LWTRNLEEPVTYALFKEVFGYSYITFEAQLKEAVHSEDVNYRKIHINDIPKIKPIKFEVAKAEELNAAKALAVVRSDRTEDLVRYIPDEKKLKAFQSKHSKLYASEIEFWLALYTEIRSEDGGDDLEK